MNISAIIETSCTLAFFGGGPWELAIVGGIALLVFGNRLPGAAKSLGMSFSAFKKGVKEGEEDLDSAAPTVETPAPPEKVESQS